jgi:hypothetical protein
MGFEEHREMSDEVLLYTTSMSSSTMGTEMVKRAATSHCSDAIYSQYRLLGK